MRMSRPLLSLALLLPLTLGACGKPKPPDREQKPEPQATVDVAETHAELRDAMQQPIRRAERTEADVQQAAGAQRKAIEDAGG